MGKGARPNVYIRGCDSYRKKRERERKRAVKDNCSKGEEEKTGR